MTNLIGNVLEKDDTSDGIIISNASGGELTLKRDDATVLLGEVIGTIRFYSNDSTLATQNLVATLVVVATANYATDAAQGTLTINVTGNAAMGSPIEHIKFAPTTVAKIGFFGVAPVVRPTALTTALTTISPPAYTPDTIIQAVTSSSPFGFVNANEGNTVVNSVANLMTRVAELELKLQGLGLLT